MTLLDWLPAISTTSLLGLVLWLAREAISTRLKRSVQHEFDEKIESVKSDFRAAEERLKAQLREKETEISALRSGTLSALASRQASLDKRRLEAMDQLWAAFNSLGTARNLAASLSVLNIKAIAEVTERDPQARQFVETIGAGFDQAKIDHESANKARLFVSPMAWAVFAAYRSITTHSIIRWHALKNGLGAKDFANREAIEKTIVAALPQYNGYLEKHGPDAYYYLLDELEAKLLSELQSMMNGNDTDKASLAQAAEIIKQANALQTKTDEASASAI